MFITKEIGMDLDVFKKNIIKLNETADDVINQLDVLERDIDLFEIKQTGVNKMKTLVLVYSLDNMGDWEAFDCIDKADEFRNEKTDKDSWNITEIKVN